MIVGTAGHIDHGKTSVVRALTGVDTDRLKEEKARGISIELGYAYTALPSGEVLGFVDVPGHERLVHTMVAGVGGIDYALLVIAADDGIMPQTREHLAILELLGITRGAIALTKVDRVDDARIRDVKAQIAALLAPTALANIPVFPLAATVPDDGGIAALRTHLHAVAATWPKRPEDGLFRLAIDRVFTVPGWGTVATGTARAGRVQVGDLVAVMPAGTPVRVRSIHAQHRDTGVGAAGERCALNLAGIEKTALARGDWLADPRALAADHPDRRALAPPRRRRCADGPRGAAHSSRYCASGCAGDSARRRTSSNPAASARVQLVFDAPICASPGDPFIARDAQALRTIGGGTVIDPYAPARRRRRGERLAVLDATESLLAGEGIEPLLRQLPQGLEMRELARLCGRPPEGISMPTGVRLIEAGGERFAMLESHWRALCERALGTLRTFHAQQPDEPGIDRARLRRMTMPNLGDALWRVAIDELLERHALRRTGHWLHLPEHRIVLGDRERELAQKLFCAIAAGRFDPPWVRDLAARVRSPEEEVRGLLRKCVAQGEVYQIVRDLFYHRDCVRELRRVLEELANRARGAARGPLSRCHRRRTQARDSDFGVLRPCWLYSAHARCAGAACRQQLAR